MPRLRRPNEPCWCGSGRKYKRCHRDRDLKPVLTSQQIIEQQLNLRIDLLCVHPAAGSSCRGHIIKAHSIQRGGGLTRIAEGGHVLTFNSRALIVPGRAPATTLPHPGRVGIHEASTFTGFCEHHDATTFAPVETVPFTGSKQQVFLLSYRALASEYFARRYQERVNRALREANTGRPIHEQIAIDRDLAYASAGAALGFERTRNLKAGYDSILTTGDFSNVGGFIVELDRAPEVLSTGLMAPEFDFQGGEIQDLTTPSTAFKDATFSLIVPEGIGTAVFGWVSPNEPAVALVESWKNLSADDKPHGLLRFTFEHFENTYFTPSWWRALSQDARDKLSRRFLSGNMTTDREPGCLTDDGMRLVGWGVRTARDVS